MKFLSLNGVSILWRRIKETFARKDETIKDISRDDTTFTVTKADGTTFEFTQKDTTYDVATTASSGLMSAADKAKLNGVESGAQENVIESVSVNGTKQQVTAKGVDITVPAALSDLTDDVGYLIEESDPTVPTWAKQPQKPAYTASEVGALPADTHIPTDVSELNNDAGYLTKHQDISGIEDAIAGLTTKLNALADSDDTTLDQLSEIVAYIKNNKSLIDGITTGKVSVDDIVDSLTSTATNKPLSAKQGKVLKDMIDGIVVPTKVSQLTNDAGYLTEHQDISGKQDVITDLAVIRSGASLGATALQEESDPTVPAWAKASAKPTYTAAEVGALPDDTVIPSKVSQLTNDSGFITSANTPQSDWAQNDSTALDYVKNRVCYTGDPVMTVIATGTMPAGEIYSENITFTDAAETLFNESDLGGIQYSFTIGEITYTGTVYSIDEDGYYIVGNPRVCMQGDESYPDNGQPFAFDFGGFFLPEDGAFAEDTEFSLSVPISPIYKLGDKYLNGSLIKRGTGQYSVILNGEKSGLTASGSNSVAEGNYTIASGENSHAEGNYTIASGENSHAEGCETTASGFSSHAEGLFTKALGSYDHSEGSYSVASGGLSHSEGYYTTASGEASHSEGGSSGNDVLSTSFGISLTGSANATTYTVTTIPFLQPLVGFYIKDKRVLSETYDGSGNVKTVTLEETLSTTAITGKNFTIGKYGTSASGKNSHSEGFYSSATGYASHAEGFGTYANHRSQHVFGEWNKHDGVEGTPNVRGTYVEIVGNGTYDNKSNARTLDWNGNEVLAGKLTVGAAPTANMDVATKKYVDDAVAGSGSAVTYTLSISNNVITLTGSDGSTSSVTLPVYAGGVSS